MLPERAGDPLQALRRGRGTLGSASSPPRPDELLTWAAPVDPRCAVHALPARDTHVHAQQSPRARHPRGAGGGPQVGLVIRKVQLITGHNPFVLLHVICLLSVQMTPIMRVNNEIRRLFMPRFFLP